MKVVLIAFLALFISGCSSKNIAIKPLKRVALVIGNQSYKYKALENPIHDAKKMVEVLKYLNFDVITDNDVNADKFIELLEKFKNKLDHNTIAFIYFAGHGNTLVQGSIESYLLMVGKKHETLVSIYKIYEYLAEGNARYNLICLDTCMNYRKTNNERNTRGVLYRGDNITINIAKKMKYKFLNSTFAKPPENTYTAYATSPNERARDKGIIDPTHSPFAKYLIEHLKDEVSFQEILRRIRKDMKKELNGNQTNYEVGSLTDYIFLNPQKGDRPITVSF